MSRDKQADKAKGIRMICETAKSKGETLRITPDFVLELMDEVVAEKERASNLIADLLFAFINKDADCPHDFEIKAFEEAILYLQEHDQSSKYSPDLFRNHLKRMREVIGNE
jgi:hypothetical protein